MKVKVWVEFSEEIDVEVGKDEILAAFSESPDPGETWFVVLNRFALCLNALPDKTIAAWTASQRQGVHAYLTKHTARFAEQAALEPAKQEEYQKDY